MWHRVENMSKYDINIKVQPNINRPLKDYQRVRVSGSGSGHLCAKFFDIDYYDRISTAA